MSGVTLVQLFRYVLLALGLLVAGTVLLLYVAFVRRRRRPGAKTLVVVVGDSYTHATLSADYLAMLRQRLGGDGYEFVNAGRNGNTSGDVLKRMDAVVACQPDVVTILIGNNDILDHAKEEGAAEAFRENLAAIVTRLRTQTKARIALLTLPPLGEALTDDTNRVVDRHNRLIQQIAAEQGVVCLSLHEAVIAIINKHAREDRAPPPYALRFSSLFMAAVRRYLLRQGWDEIAAANGFVVMTDQTHLSDRGGRAVADLIADWLQETAAASLP